MRRLVVAILALSSFCLAQPSPKSALPSDAEINELLAKADQKVNDFETAIKLVGPDLDAKDDLVVLRKNSSSAATAHEIIHLLQKNGPTAYGLVMLVSTLENIALDASKTAIVLMARQDIGAAHTQTNLLVLGQASTSCRDIAELLLHATLRMIDVEEEVVRSISSDKH